MIIAVIFSILVGRRSGPVDLCISSEFKSLRTSCSVACIRFRGCTRFTSVSMSGRVGVSLSSVWEAKWSLSKFAFCDSSVIVSQSVVSSGGMVCRFCRPMSDFNVLWYLKGSCLYSRSFPASFCMC